MNTEHIIFEIVEETNSQKEIISICLRFYAVCFSLWSIYMSRIRIGYMHKKNYGALYNMRPEKLC